MRTSVKLGMTAAAVLTSAGLFAAPAMAATHLTPTKSKTTAGYFAGPSQKKVTTASGGLNVPTLTCPASGDVTMNSQVGLFDIHTSDSVGFGFIIDCSSGTAFYSNSYVSVGNAITGYSSGTTPISPGDNLTYSMSQKTSAGTLTATISDTTNHLSASVTAGDFTPALKDLSAYTTFSPTNSSGNVTPIPSFSPAVTFTATTFNGKTLGQYGGLTEENMWDGSTEQVATSAITAGTFTTTFVHA
jgi:hypothetical protein